MTDRQTLAPILHRAIAFRQAQLDAEPHHEGALRLLNGFTEGIPGLSIDLFAKTAVLQDYSAHGVFAAAPQALVELLLEELPSIKAIVLKLRNASSAAARNGKLIYGVKPDTAIREFGVRYAVDLMLHRDNSFYPDTRLLRKHIRETMQGATLLNTFAYTGSLGVAAWAGGADFVLQTDLSEKFLAVAKRSCDLNAFHYTRKNFLCGDFFRVAARLKQEERRFDCIILDPPFFSRTANGTVDLLEKPLAPINKLRPLLKDGGELIVVNNSLFLSGERFLSEIDQLCDGFYLTREAMLPVPDDFIGNDPDYLQHYAVSPTPFRHPTKIVTLRVRTKPQA